MAWCRWLLGHLRKSSGPNPANTWRNNNVIITSKRRRSDGTMTLLSHHVSTGECTGPALEVLTYTELYLEWNITEHDDVITWNHFPRYWPFVRGIHRSPVNSPHKGQWRGALMFSLISVWINGCVNNHEAGDLRRHRAHYDVIVMICARWFNLQFDVRYQAVIGAKHGIIERKLKKFQQSCTPRACIHQLQRKSCCLHILLTSQNHKQCMQLDNKISYYLQWRLKSRGAVCDRCRHPTYQILELISPRKNGRHFADDIFTFSWMTIFVFW